MTPEQRRLSAEHLPVTLRIARSHRWAMWSEAESTAVELLCQAAARYHDDGHGAFGGYIATYMDRWLWNRYSSWCAKEPRFGSDHWDGVVCLPSRDPADVTVEADAAARELAQLPKRTVRIARLVASGMKKEDIASQLGVSPSAVSQALRFGRERIESYRRNAA